MNITPSGMRWKRGVGAGSVAVALTAALALGGCANSSGGASESAGAGTTGSGSDGGFVIGVSNGFIGNTWRAQYISEIEKVGDELKQQGVIKDLVIENATGDVTEQLSQLDDLLAQGVDAVLVNPISSTMLEPFVAKAKAQGVMVVINDNASAYEGTYFIGYPQYDYWSIEMSWLADQLGGKGDIVLVRGIAGQTATNLRQQGADAVLANNPDIKVLGSAEGELTQTKAESVTSAFLSAHQDIDGVLVEDAMNEGVLRAFEKAGRPFVPITGDYNFGYLRKWQQTPDLTSITVTNSPHIGADGLKITARLLQGYTFNDGELVGNPLDDSLKNSFMVPYAYVITRDGGSQDWMDGVVPEATQSISLDDALKGNEDRADGEYFGGVVSDEYIDSVMTRE